MARAGNPQAVFERVMTALKANDLAAAATQARKLTKMAPDTADAWSVRANVAQRAGAHADAAKYLRRALQLKPGDPGLLNNLGNAHAETGDHGAAAAYYEKSLAIRPDAVDTRMNLGNALMTLHRADEAADQFALALERDPGNPGARLNLGGAYLVARRPDLALAEFERLRADGVDGLDVRANIYNALVALDRLDDADRAAARLLEAAGDDPKAIVATAILHFLRERWGDAWRAYAARWRWKPDEARPFPQPWWNGEDLAGRKLLVWGEQGLGDEIMHAAMVPDLVAQGARVVLECEPRLLALFRRSFPAVLCGARADPPARETAAADIDFQVPAGNLGIWLRADEAAFAGGRPFLAADLPRAEMLRAKYRAGDDVALVGITWRSLNPDIGSTKSMTLDDLAPLLATPGVRFVDLQYGDTAADRAALAGRGIALLHDPEIDPMRDIDGHAAQVAAMDLVISISNTTVHLAGAMGVPVWCLIQGVSDRRWLVDRADSPWYRSVRLYRQENRGDWRAPVARAAADLATWLAGR